MLLSGSADAAVSKSSQNIRYFGDFCGDGGSLALGMLWKVPCANREVILCQKNGLKQAFRGKFISCGESNAGKGTKWVFFGQPPLPPQMWPTPVLNHPPYPCIQLYWLLNHLREKKTRKRWQLKWVFCGIMGHPVCTLYSRYCCIQKQKKSS